MVSSLGASLVGMSMFGVCRLLLRYDREGDISISSPFFENWKLEMLLTLDFISDFNDVYNAATLRCEPRHALIELIIIEDRFQFRRGSTQNWG